MKIRIVLADRIIQVEHNRHRMSDRRFVEIVTIIRYLLYGAIGLGGLSIGCNFLMSSIRR